MPNPNALHADYIISTFGGFDPADDKNGTWKHSFGDRYTYVTADGIRLTISSPTMTCPAVAEQQRAPYIKLHFDMDILFDEAHLVELRGFAVPIAEPLYLRPLPPSTEDLTLSDAERAAAMTFDYPVPPDDHPSRIGLRTIIADALSAARAGAVPGLEPLYLARAAQHREQQHAILSAMQRERQYAEEQIGKQRETITAALYSLGVDTATLGTWMTDGDDMYWGIDGAVISTNDLRERLYVYPAFDFDEGGDYCPDSVGHMPIPTGSVSLQPQQTRLIDLIDAARARTAEIAARRAAPPRTPEPQYMVAVFEDDVLSGIEIADWLNGVDKQGYGSPVMVGSGRFIYVTVSRVIPFDRADED